MQAVSDKIDDDVYECLTLEGSVNARNHSGGTAPAEVAAPLPGLGQDWGAAPMPLFLKDAS